MIDDSGDSDIILPESSGEESSADVDMGNNHTMINSQAMRRRNYPRRPVNFHLGVLSPRVPRKKQEKQGGRNSPNGNQS